MPCRVQCKDLVSLEVELDATFKFFGHTKIPSRIMLNSNHTMGGIGVEGHHKYLEI
jgi:hypothetical protein